MRKFPWRSRGIKMTIAIKAVSPILYICPNCRAGFTAEEGFDFAERHVKTHIRGGTRAPRKKAPSFDTFLDSLPVGYNGSESAEAG